MILANVRQMLGRDDAQLALRLVARGGSGEEYERAEGVLREGGIDALLDDPRLLAAVFESPYGARVSLPLFAYVVVRHALRRVGEHDRVLADYAASVLMHFGLRDAATRVGEADDEVYTTLADLLRDVESADGRRGFLVRAHLGNYALWLSGLFPDYIESRRWRRGGPDLDYYEEMGRRGFQLAAGHRLASENGLAPLYAAAAERFALLRVALNSVSDSLLFPNHHSPDRLLRQVRDEARWKLAS
ncbi:MAG: hypothetical protein ACJ79S_04725 [Gemmatimonadaceae bacterium]